MGFDSLLVVKASVLLALEARLVRTKAIFFFRIVSMEKPIIFEDWNNPGSLYLGYQEDIDWLRDEGGFPRVISNKRMLHDIPKPVGKMNPSNLIRDLLACLRGNAEGVAYNVVSAAEAYLEYHEKKGFDNSGVT